MTWQALLSFARPYSGVASARQGSLGIRSIHVPAGANAGAGSTAAEGAGAGTAAHQAWGAHIPAPTAYTGYGGGGGVPTTAAELEAQRRALDERILKLAAREAAIAAQADAD
jgi:hypothetical protein